MPELLSASIHYLIYQSKGLATGKSVTVLLLDPPDFSPGVEQPLTEIGNGSYGIAVDFTREGLHLAHFFENGIPTVIQTYRVYRIREIVGELVPGGAPKAHFRL